MYTHLPRIPRSENIEMKWELLVTIDHIDQESELFKPKILSVSIITVWKEPLEVGQPGVLFVYCHFPPSVGPGTSHLVIYSLSFPIYKTYFPSNAEIL